MHIPREIHIDVTPEPSQYHEVTTNTLFYGVNLYPEYRLSSSSYPQSTSEQDRAKDYVQDILDNLTNKVSSEAETTKVYGFYLYLYKVVENVSGFECELVSEVPVNVTRDDVTKGVTKAFKKWIEKKNQALVDLNEDEHDYYVESIPSETEFSGNNVSVGQVLAANTAEPAPISHEMGQSVLVKIDEDDLKGIDPCFVLLPYFSNQEPEPSIACSLEGSGVNSLSSVDRIEVCYDNGYNDDDKADPEDKKVNTYSSRLTKLPALGLIDKDTGFLNISDSDALKRAIHRLKESLGSDLWSLPAFIEHGAIDRKIKLEPNLESDEQYLQRIAWSSVFGVVCAFDQIFTALSPPQILLDRVDSEYGEVLIHIGNSIEKYIEIAEGSSFPPSVSLEKFKSFLPTSLSEAYRKQLVNKGFIDSQKELEEKDVKRLLRLIQDSSGVTLTTDEKTTAEKLVEFHFTPPESYQDVLELGRSLQDELYTITQELQKEECVSRIIGTLTSDIGPSRASEETYVIGEFLEVINKKFNDDNSPIDDATNQKLAKFFSGWFGSLSNGIKGLDGMEAIRSSYTQALVDTLLENARVEKSNKSTKRKYKQLSLENLEQAFTFDEVDDVPYKSFFYARLHTIEIQVEDRKTEFKIVDIAQRLGRPIYLDENEDTEANLFPDLYQYQNVIASDYFSHTNGGELRLKVPDSVAPPIPIQIGNDFFGAELDDFMNFFNGFGVLVKRKSDNNPKEKDASWAHANLVELTVEVGEGSARKALLRNTINQISPVVSDGRATLFVNYEGYPFSGAAFAECQVGGVELSDDERLAYSNFAKQDDVHPDSNYNALPGLAYGCEFSFAVFGVTRIGCVPKIVQDNVDDDLPPWKVRDLKLAEESEIETKSITVPYQRTTAVGQISIETPEEEVSQLRKSNATLDGITPLFHDYPRQSVSYYQGGSRVTLDLYRNTDGSGALKSVVKKDKLIQIKDGFLRGDDRLRLKVEIIALKSINSTLKEDVFAEIKTSQLPNEEYFDINIKVGDEITTDIIFHNSDQSNPNEKVFNSPSDLPAKLEELHWLRISLVEDAKEQKNATTDNRENGFSEGTVFSFSDTSQDDYIIGYEDTTNQETGSVGIGFNYFARPALPEVQLLGGDSEAWKPEVLRSQTMVISFPKVQYLDFDRWVSNPNMKTLWGISIDDDTKLIKNLKSFLLKCYLVRHLDEKLAFLLDNLPDPSVSGLLLNIETQDTLKNVSLNAKRSYKALNLKNEVTDNLPTEKDELNIESCIIRLEAIVTASTFKFSIGTSSRVDGARHWGIGIIAAGSSIKVSVRSCVLKSHFEQPITNSPSVFNSEMRLHSVNSYKNSADDFLLFGDAEQVFESMLEQPDEKYLKTHVDVGILGGSIECFSQGTTRSYSLRFSEQQFRKLINEPVNNKPVHHYNFIRNVGNLAVHTQRWRFMGTPIYNWPDLTKYRKELCPEGSEWACSGNPVLEIKEGAFTAFEKELFNGRSPLDTEKTSEIKLAPISKFCNNTPSQSHELYKIEWSSPTATMFRHNITFEFRYAAALRGKKKIYNAAVKGEDWLKRVVLLADSSGIEITRPQVRGLIPLSHGVQNHKKKDKDQLQSPAVLCALEEEPLSYAGLAERVLAEVKTGINFGFTESESTVQPLDLQKEAGSDPRLILEPLSKDLGRSLSLTQDGPIGLTYESSNISAPLWKNSQYIFKPFIDGSDYFEELSMGLTVRRFIDPSWTVSGMASPKEKAFINRSFLIKNLKDQESLSLVADKDSNSSLETVVDLKVIHREGTKVLISRDLVYDTSEKLDKIDSSKSSLSDAELTLCVVPNGVVINVLHEVLGDANYRMTIISSPKDTSVNDLLNENDQRIIGSIEWSIPAFSNARYDFITINSEGSQTKMVDYYPVTVSSPTQMEWTMTRRDSYAIHYRDTVAENKQFHLNLLGAKIIKKGAKHSVKFLKEGKDVWLQPNVGQVDRPKSIHRHIAVIGLEETTDEGKILERYQSTTLMIGKQAPLINGNPVKFRLIEFETPAVVIAAKGVTAEEKHKFGYFDMKSTGGEKSDEFRLMFRFVAVGAKVNVTLLKFKVYKTDYGEPEVIELKLEISAPIMWMGVRIAKGTDSTTAHIVALDERGDFVNLPDAIRNIDDWPNEIAAIVISGLEATSSGVIKDVWADVSLLHSMKKGKAENFDYDWFFNHNKEERAEEDYTSTSTLGNLREAQARIVSVSPSIDINK